MPQAQEKKQTTQAQKKAMLKYQAKYIEMRLRVTPESTSRRNVYEVQTTGQQLKTGL